MNDLINRRDAIKAIESLPNCYNGYSDTYDKAYIIGTLEEVPSAERKGKWINHRNDDGHHIADCSICGNTLQWFDDEGGHRFCPNCGADMRKEVTK